MKDLLNMEHRIWTSHNKDSCNAILLQKAQLYKKINMLECSSRELSRIKPDSNLYRKITYEKALISFLSNDFNQSYNLLILLPDSIKYGIKPNLLLFLLTLNELRRWEECKQLLSKFNLAGKISTEEIALLPNSINYKSPDKAYQLSTFCPGLGQIYAGSLSKGCTNMAIQAGTIWFTYQQYLLSYYITRTFAGIYPWYRFYSGGRTQSYNLAVTYNEIRESKIKKQFQNVIKKLF